MDPVAAPLVDLARNLIDIESTSGGEAAVTTWLARCLRERGYQVTDERGLASFTTIFPGWYSGRAVHIHFKIRVEESASRSYEFTSQLFFDEALIDRVHARVPYAARGQRNRRNSDDSIFGRAGDQLTLALRPKGAGYTSTFGIGLDLSDDRVGRSDGSRSSRRG